MGREHALSHVPIRIVPPSRRRQRHLRQQAVGVALGPTTTPEEVDRFLQVVASVRSYFLR